jgi:hypothetical protein
MEQRYTFNEEQIVHEILDGEVVLVNLDNGYYYILQGTGSEIWQHLTSGAPADETVAALLRQYTGEPEAVAQAVRDFVSSLVAEALLQPVEAEPASAPVALPETADPAGPFTLPVMFKYTDMANLIQMDPIREYDETGWPSRRSAAPAKQSR